MKLNDSYLTYLELHNDIKLNKNYFDEYKIKLLDDLHKDLDIEWFDINLISKLNSKNNLLDKFAKKV